LNSSLELLAHLIISFSEQFSYRGTKYSGLLDNDLGVVGASQKTQNVVQVELPSETQDTDLYYENALERVRTRKPIHTCMADSEAEQEAAAKDYYANIRTNVSIWFTRLRVVVDGYAFCLKVLLAWVLSNVSCQFRHPATFITMNPVFLGCSRGRHLEWKQLLRNILSWLRSVGGQSLHGSNSCPRGNYQCNCVLSAISSSQVVVAGSDTVRHLSTEVYWIDNVSSRARVHRVNG
jgi:hypothetical protein